MQQAVLFLVLAVIWSATAPAGERAVPVMMRADGDLDTCSVGEVAASAAVRSGPGAGHRKVDSLNKGARVWIFEESGEWIGVAYDASEIECSPIKKDRTYDGPGKSGWVHKARLRLLAG